MGAMLEIRFHGRGGQGVRMSARILGRTVFLDGFQTQDFALYAAERRGAPVTSFVRYDKEPVLERGYIFEPDNVIALDDTLNFGVMLEGLKKNGFIIINTAKKEDFFRKLGIKEKIYCIDATSIALHIMGRPIANCAILGALVKLLKIPFESLEKAIEIEFTEEGHREAIEKNIEAAKACFEMVK